MTVIPSVCVLHLRHMCVSITAWGLLLRACLGDAVNVLSLDLVLHPLALVPPPLASRAPPFGTPPIPGKCFQRRRRRHLASASGDGESGATNGFNQIDASPTHLGAGDHHLATDEDKEHHLGLTHAVNEAGEQFRLIGCERCVRVHQLLQLDGELHVRAGNDVLDREVLDKCADTSVASPQPHHRRPGGPTLNCAGKPSFWMIRAYLREAILAIYSVFAPVHTWRSADRAGRGEFTRAIQKSAQQRGKPGDAPACRLRKSAPSSSGRGCA